MVRVGPSDFEREKVTDMCSGNYNAKLKATGWKPKYNSTESLRSAIAS
jgi:hypothetical protein